MGNFFLPKRTSGSFFLLNTIFLQGQTKIAVHVVRVPGSRGRPLNQPFPKLTNWPRFCCPSLLQAEARVHRPGSGPWSSGVRTPLKGKRLGGGSLLPHLVDFYGKCRYLNIQSSHACYGSITTQVENLSSWKMSFLYSFIVFLLKLELN